jgi:hypothetical protein
MKRINCFCPSINVPLQLYLFGISGFDTTRFIVEKARDKVQSYSSSDGITIFDYKMHK